jgi:hypothetical protein
MSLYSICNVFEEGTITCFKESNPRPSAAASTISVTDRYMYPRLSVIRFILSDAFTMVQIYMPLTTMTSLTNFTNILCMDFWFTSDIGQNTSAWVCQNGTISYTISWWPCIFPYQVTNCVTNLLRRRPLAIYGGGGSTSYNLPEVYYVFKINF